MRRLGGLLLAAAIAINVQSAGAAEPADLLREFGRTQIVISTAGQRCILFDIYVANTAQLRRNGLMFVESMDIHEGMLFIYEGTSEITMWMKNTLLPLDMLFFDTSLTIRHIHRNAVPLSEAVISSQGSVAGVIELNGGAADQLGIAVGDRILLQESGGSGSAIAP
jgi:uncharacterized membrane protein (UPF0127 family)